MLPLNNVLISSLSVLDREQEYIFMGRNGRPVGSVRKALQTACKKAGVTKHVNPHLFRHSWATHLMAAGVNMSVIQKYLGHARITTTEWYSHVDVEIMREAGKGVMAFLSVNPQITE